MIAGLLLGSSIGRQGETWTPAVAGQQSAAMATTAVDAASASHQRHKPVGNTYYTQSTPTADGPALA